MDSLSPGSSTDCHGELRWQYGYATDEYGSSTVIREWLPVHHGMSRFYYGVTTIVILCITNIQEYVRSDYGWSRLMPIKQECNHK